MDFIPLAIWAVGFMIASSIDDYVSHKIDQAKFKADKHEDPEAFEKIWFWGCVIFLVLGFIS